MHIQKTTAFTGNCRLRICHSIKQKEFVDWKYRIFKQDFCQSTKFPTLEIRKNFITKNYVFYTSYKKEFIETHNLWYSLQDSSKNYVKKIPLDIAEILTHPLSLAIWYLDDGTKRKDAESCRIATQSFSKNEHILLKDCIRQNFNFSAKIEDWGKKKNGEKILFTCHFKSR